ncbi:P-loop containing nucleoside triphosphate hydrolase protein [Paraphysoderma sedebokerense]|nr:P-loop containing nucleoside triphosphate hydrolase protein [Paraphysoderma sedebokerense]
MVLTNTTSTQSRLRERLNLLQGEIYSPSRIPTGLHPSDIIEIHGPTNAGKTEILYHIILTTILPFSWNYVIKRHNISITIHLDGGNRKVVFIDCDGRFDICRVRDMISSHLRHCVQCWFNCYQEELAEKQQHQRENSQTPTITIPDLPTSNEISAFTESVLSNLYIFNPTSLFNLLVTLYSLNNTVPNIHQVSYVMIDSLSAFYWIEQAEEKLQSQNRRQKSSTDSLHPSTTLIKRLCNILSDMTLNHVQSRDGVEDLLYYRDYMGKEWNEIVKAVGQTL